MTKSISILTAFLILISITTKAQTETIKRDRFTLNITNPSEIKKVETKTELVDAFFETYPQFARADGYRTKREVTLTIKPEVSKNVMAKEGEVVLNSNWINNNPKMIKNSLQSALSANWVSSDTTTKKGYTLIFVNKDPAIAKDLQSRLTQTFFAVYPKLVKTYNKKAKREVLFVVDTAYKAVAEASGGRILFSAGYMKKNNTDVDVVTHEGMHVVQEYGYGSGPVWLTEGIADYVRYKFGYDNIGSKWSLPAFSDKHSYKNSYRITARFFVWLEDNVKKGIIKTLDDQLRRKAYTENSWKEITGQTLDELWLSYAKSPDVKLTYQKAVWK
ncbi:MAG: secretory protein [Flavobacteriales bacterium]|nr:MAG: secretory protein [Flavobacteriales bacterium]